MKPAELDHIREDIRHAVVENRNDDPALLPELLSYVLTELGKLATEPYEQIEPYIYFGEKYEAPDKRAPIQIWADEILERCQIRAVSQVPFGEPAIDSEPPHTLEHL